VKTVLQLIIKAGIGNAFVQRVQSQLVVENSISRAFTSARKFRQDLCLFYFNNTEVVL
jgi:hypothetical protein